MKYEEDSPCPECATGKLIIPKAENCSCHINPPCSECVSAKLTCNLCGWQVDEQEPVASYRSCGPVSEACQKRVSVEIGNGKRLFDFDYDSRSGSTMVWRGRYEGDVTPDDIIKHFGDGTFGHRGPIMTNGMFSYTLITD